ncbi:MAG: hypothetical protein NTY38_06895 [Acidobacteria bacterium]|nr:hypothetical protein [Acidobacteriota bacterium]
MITRRELLAATLAACGTHRLATPYKYNRLVVTASGVPGAFDQLSVDCPFVFRNGDRYSMTYVGFDGAGYQTGLASSHNLVDWHPEGAILRRDPNSPIAKYNIALNWILRENDVRSPGRLRKVHGRYLGVYHAYPGSGYEQGPAVIGLAWSHDLKAWTLDPPCLRGADGAAWEKAGLYKPCLLEACGTYYLFYNAKDLPTRWKEQTGVATSKDLKTWTRYEGNPILRNGPAGSPDEKFASDPCVLQDGAHWAFFYFGLDTKGVARDLLARGPDLYHAEKCGEVLIDVGPPGSIDHTYAHKPSVITHNGVLYHFYCAVAKKDGKEIRGISVARSTPW